MKMKKEILGCGGITIERRGEAAIKINDLIDLFSSLLAQFRPLIGQRRAQREKWRVAE